MPESEDALFPKVRVRVRQDADPVDLEDVLAGAAPGECRAVTLPELLAALHLLDAYIPVNSGAEAMIRRLVAALAARIGGLDHGADEEWEDALDELLKAGRLNKAAVDAYFTTQVFDLAHPTRPLLQHPDLAAECSKSASPAKLHFDRSSGNNAAWWDHTPETQPLDPLTALEGILLWRGYGPCGLGGQRTHRVHRTTVLGGLINQ
ncbi:type I-E CRISPR-associated protein Cse1/CasA [Streptomyces sp. LHD-70]|uniref:type I-E CRISPR-associated protein Cse1/CasA n=1 Tax=Streptomyces sp. LHD-70 TaxID=3072140 RepID=UPI00280FD45C|nr:type I-E CRISPR-associated protein Cse1/CasA [Streptomyces sp. LHD-70]MDQ8706088.1 type I-E CRISPR-associated protein Cse1/CasA [Streptomyces sp. LHD-70]